MMSARLATRAPTSILEKFTARISQTINESAVLQPISSSVNSVARKAIFRALTHIKFGSITIIEDFVGRDAKPHYFGKASSDNISSSAIGRHALNVTLTIHDIVSSF